MQHFFKKNITLLIGITLPLLLMLLFFVAGQINKITIEPPQYDAIFATGNYHNTWNIEVKNEKISITRYKEYNKQNQYNESLKLFRFDHESLTSTPLDVDFNFNNVEENTLKSEIIDTLNKHKLLSATVSPDGYHFEQYYRSNSGLAGDIFGFGRRGNYALRKGNRIVHSDKERTFHNADFIAWIDE